MKEYKEYVFLQNNIKEILEFRHSLNQAPVVEPSKEPTPQPEQFRNATATQEKDKYSADYIAKMVGIEKYYTNTGYSNLGNS